MLLKKRPRFSPYWGGGKQETKFVESIVDEVSHLEALADNCMKIYVWHVKTLWKFLGDVRGDPLSPLIKELI